MTAPFERMRSEAHASTEGGTGAVGTGTGADALGEERRPARRVQRMDYDQSGRRGRGKRKRTETTTGAYMDRAVGSGKEARIRRRQVVVSRLTVDRIVGGRYDWQDGALAKNS